MFDKQRYYILNLFLLAICRAKSRSFNRAAASIKNVQEKLIFESLERNKNTEYGICHNFAAVKTVNDYQSKIPLTEFDSYSPYIGMILKGGQGVLTSEKILSIAISSGSTSASKYIPYTKSLKAEFQKAISPWVYDLLSRHSRILSGSMYFSITPSVSPPKVGSAVIPVGFENDSEYFGLPERLLLKWLLSVPEEVQKIRDPMPFKYVTLLFILKEKRLSFISVWSPTFLLILLKHACEWHESLIYDIARGTINPPNPIEPELKSHIIKKFSKNEKRAKEIETIFKSYEKSADFQKVFVKIWPHLAVISCWADGNSASYIKEIKEYFPEVEIQGKGLLATEGVVSFPLTGEAGCALAIESHFFEFEEVNTPSNIMADTRLKLAHQIKKGERYSVIITTGGGLYRYKLNDIIEVMGFKGQCPLVKFIGKKDKISDIFGEKLNEYYVTEVLNSIFVKNSISPCFYMVAPERDKISGSYFYSLFIQAEDGFQVDVLRSVEKELETRLNDNYHYSYCRGLGQLSGARVFIIDGYDAVGIYNEVLREGGQKEGNIKASVLHSKIGWSGRFEGAFLDAINKFTSPVLNAKIVGN